MTRRTEDYLKLFTQQFRDRNRIIGYAKGLLKEGDLLTDIFIDLKEARNINTAIGIQLDRLGQLLGEERLGRSDEDYRAALKFRVYTNTGDANAASIIDATTTLSGGSFIRYWENYPAGFQVFTDGLGVLDITGNVIQDFDLTDQDGVVYEVTIDGEGTFDLEVRTAFEDPQALAGFLSGIAPAGTDRVLVSYSLGNWPLFGFSDGFSEADLIGFDNIDGEFEFTFEDGSLISVLTGAPNPSPDGFGGFAEVKAVPLVVSVTPLEFDLQVFDGNKYVDLELDDSGTLLVNDFEEGPQEEDQLQVSLPQEFELIITLPSGEYNLVDNNDNLYFVNDINESPVLEDLYVLPQDEPPEGEFQLTEAMVS